MILVLGLVSIWVTPETDVTTGIGLISAGLAFALQQVIISLAGYIVILRGDTFTSETASPSAACAATWCGCGS
ncbi:hypothetical protein ISU10_04965 [Nocardioides agariphilus]|uniref:Uncharacterized protein n=1 Tax=Nocardioides agariphilus TaxID=433664 RepID=A0A930YHH2_9ACTN|nr:hypothetical protein [Nocardioides agariphilus]